MTASFTVCSIAIPLSFIDDVSFSINIIVNIFTILVSLCLLDWCVKNAIMLVDYTNQRRAGRND
jgi:multidrug efflux pump subunit AcrB